MKKDKIRIRLCGFDSFILDKSLASIIQTVKKTGSKISGPVLLPTKIKKMTVLRSPHRNKKSREQFEIRTYKRLLDIYNIMDETMNSLIKLEIPAGVDIQITQ